MNFFGFYRDSEGRMRTMEDIGRIRPSYLCTTKQTESFQRVVECLLNFLLALIFLFNLLNFYHYGKIGRLFCSS